MIDFIEEEQPREEYGRYGNPGERVAERKLAALEGAETAVLFSSGMAAIVGLLMAKLNAGDEVDLLRRVLPPQPRVLHEAPVAVRREDACRCKACDYDAMEAAITPQHQAAGERVAHQSAPEHRRPGAVRRDRPPTTASRR